MHPLINKEMSIYLNSGFLAEYSIPLLAYSLANYS